MPPLPCGLYGDEARNVWLVIARSEQAEADAALQPKEDPPGDIFALSLHGSRPEGQGPEFRGSVINAAAGAAGYGDPNCVLSAEVLTVGGGASTASGGKLAHHRLRKGMYRFEFEVLPGGQLTAGTIPSNYPSGSGASGSVTDVLPCGHKLSHISRHTVPALLCPVRSEHPSSLRRHRAATLPSSPRRSGGYGGTSGSPQSPGDPPAWMPRAALARAEEAADALRVLRSVGFKEVEGRDAAEVERVLRKLLARRADAAAAPPVLRGFAEAAAAEEHKHSPRWAAGSPDAAPPKR